jgi:hypothetical protein
MEHGPRGLKLQAVFDSPDFVSATSSDDFNFGIKELTLFKTVGPLVQLKTESFEGGKPEIIKIVPAIIADEKKVANIASTTDEGGAALSGMTTGNFIVSLVLGGSLQ